MGQNSANRIYAVIVILTAYLLVHNRSEALALIKQYNLFKRGVEELHCIEVCYGGVVYIRSGKCDDPHGHLCS